MHSRPHRHLIATGVCLVGLAAGQADAAVAGFVAGLDGVRGQGHEPCTGEPAAP